MIYSKVEGIDKNISRIVQGTMVLSRLEREQAFELLESLYESGINTFDSAHVYGGGDSDRIFGAWVARGGLRDKIVLLDKGAHHNSDRKRVTPFDITSDLHDCLARLGFSYIDLFVLHRDDEQVPVGPIVEVLNEHKDAGLINAFGGSNWSHDRIREANDYAEQHGLTGFVVSSPHYSLAESLDDPWGGSSVSITGAQGREAREWYEQNRMPLFAWSSLCGGFFSGRFNRNNLDSFTDPADRRCVRCYCGERNFQRLDRAAELAKDRGATVPQIALAYVLSGPLTCFPLMAAWTKEQARENAEAVRLTLTDAERAYLNLESDAI